MNQITMRVPIPVDEGFVRRECPYCHREFKVLLSEEELGDLTQRVLEPFWVDSGKHADEETEDHPVEEFACPYCGQRASKDSWGTQEQLAYVRIFAENIMADSVNASLDEMGRTLHSSKSSFISFRVTGQKMGKKEPWISPEIGDMDEFDLPCCGRKMKVVESRTGTTFCFFCGFPYQKK